ncbi:Protein LURP-one-related 5 [Platanthera zijinensis]|uniref:Protein LURP-one-related 5 n=1 Tax=Platanthera zijinensis TaxID=2320716 RepID=A0AAP0BCK1_9ASPA
MSSKIHPSEIQADEGGGHIRDKFIEWTIWKKSSMSFVGSDGFSVYDSKGQLSFRVDNYSRRSKYLLGELLLMDAVGKPLISLRPQILSTHGQWKGYSADGDNNSNAKCKPHIFTMRRRNSFTRKKSHDAVEVFMHGGGRGVVMAADFRIEGCFKKRCLKINGRDGEVLAQITPKKANMSVVLGDDVFRLSVKEGTTVSAEMITAFIIVMDRIC